MGSAGTMNMDAAYSRLDSGGGDMFSRNVVNSGPGNMTVNNYPQAQETKRPSAPRCPLAPPNFIGRDREIERLTKFYFGDSVLMDQLRILSVIGMGGCGKTQLVRKFMERVYKKFFKNKSHLVFYADATTVATLQASLSSIAAANGLVDTTEAVLSWMSDLEEPFFIYMDNADDPKLDLHDYFPRSTYARILITTRLRESEQNYGTGKGSAIHLSALEEEQAVELLLNTARIDQDQANDDAVQTLIKELHCHALAVVQAGAAIFKSQWTPKEYLERFQRLRTNLMDGTQDRVEAKAMDNYPSHVYTTWKLSYDRLSEPAAKLLAICAHLHHSGITEEIFERAFQGLSLYSDMNFRSPPIPFAAEELSALDFLESFAPGGEWSPDDFHHCIQEACSLSLLSYNQPTHTYSIHPLIHDCLRSVAPHPSQASFLLSATLQPIWFDQLEAAALVPHVQRVLDIWTDWRTSDPPLHPMLARALANSLFQAGRAAEAEPLQQAVVTLLERTLDNEHSLVSTARGDLALTLWDLGRYRDAEQLWREILEYERVHLGEDDPETLLAMGNLGSTVRLMARYDEAEEIEKDLLERQRRKLGMDHIDTNRALSNLALTLWRAGRYEEAEPMHNEVLEWRCRELGMDHPDTINAMRNLATTRSSMGQYEAAEPIEKQVLEWRQRVLGLKHPDTIMALSDLAWTISRSGRHEEAEPLERQAVHLATQIIGLNHPNTVVYQRNLEWTLDQLHGTLERSENELVGVGEDTSADPPTHDVVGIPPLPSVPADAVHANPDAVSAPPESASSGPLEEPTHAQTSTTSLALHADDVTQPVAAVSSSSLPVALPGLLAPAASPTTPQRKSRRKRFLAVLSAPFRPKSAVSHPPSS